MSQSMNAQNKDQGFRRQLLTTVSAAALLLVTAGTGRASDNLFTSSDRPPLWFEFGAEGDQIGSGLDPFVPAFTQAPGSFTGGSLAPVIQKPPVRSFGGEGKISFEPDGTDWVFSASIRYGRALRHKQAHVQTPGQKYPPRGAFYDAGARTAENHLVLDFQAGKDIGLGMFGTHAHSALSVGLRFAQFDARSSGFISSAPTPYDQHSFKQKNWINRSSTAIGPSIAWDAAVPLAGSPDDSLSLDWGANAAILFGRQKTKFSIQSKQTQYVYGYPKPPPSYVTSTLASARKKTVTIPNVGGFAGISWRYSAAKVSLGYRADFFFNAVDRGVAVRKSDRIGFYGPFASISIGMGD